MLRLLQLTASVHTERYLSCLEASNEPCLGLFARGHLMGKNLTSSTGCQVTGRGGASPMRMWIACKCAGAWMQQPLVGGHSAWLRESINQCN